MERSAVNLAKAVHYVGVGTVEFLYDNESKKYYFLELNPRLQVEHPVTELVSDTNLPACQILVAMGLKLSNIACIRRLFGRDPESLEEIDFDNTNKITPTKHAIACRITAEDPLKGFRPTSGFDTCFLFFSFFFFCSRFPCFFFGSFFELRFCANWTNVCFLCTKHKKHIIFSHKIFCYFVGGCHQLNQPKFGK